MAVAASPMLASSLLLQAEQQPHIRLNPVHPRDVPHSEKQGILTGHHAIDNHVLDGIGFQEGLLSAISGASGTGKSTLAVHAMATYLLTQEQEQGQGQGQVAIIDTTGAFSPLLLRDVILARLQGGLHKGGDGDEDIPNEEACGWSRDQMLKRALRLLDRVKIMRAFDFDGVVEAVEEVRVDIERDKENEVVGEAASGRKEVVEVQKSPLVRLEEVELRVDVAEEVTKRKEEMTMEVADSEDEDDELEMQLDMEQNSAQRDEGVNPALERDVYREVPKPIEVRDQDSLGGEQARGREKKGVGMIVVDTITNVVSNMMSTGQVRGMSNLL